MRDKTLGELHSALAQALVERVKDGDLSASFIRECREFLRDNGITDSRKSGPVQTLSDELPLVDPERRLPFQRPQA